MNVTRLSRISASERPRPVASSRAASSRVSRSRGAPRDRRRVPGAARRAAVDRSVKIAFGGPRPPSPDPRQEIRQTEQVEGVDAADELEVDAHGAPDLFAIPAQPFGEDRARQDVEREAGHLGADVDDASVPQRAPAVRQVVDRRLHRRGKFGHGAVGECRGERPALVAPRLALGEQAGRCASPSPARGAATPPLP